MLNCKQASQFISASFDRPLTLRERFALSAHLLMCKYCKRFSQQMQFISASVKQLLQTIETNTLIKIPATTKSRIAKSLGDSAPS